MVAKSIYFFSVINKKNSGKRMTNKRKKEIQIHTNKIKKEVI